VPQIEGFTAAGAILKSGVYALVLRGSVVYIGKSKNILSRVYTHRSMWAAKRRGRAVKHIATPGIQFDDFLYCACPEHQLDALEQALIRKYKPIHNKQHNSRDMITQPIELVIQGVALRLNDPKPAATLTRRPCL